MFDGFVQHGLRTARGQIFARAGGSGPPVLLLHGYPQTHLMWRTVAPVLAERFTVVVADLPGYGASFRPVPAADHAPHSKRALAADPDAFFDFHVRALGLGRAPDRYPPDLIAGYRALLDDVGTVEAICEDYRAGATVDREHDDADRGVRKIECPVLALWSAHGALPRFYGDVLDVWRPWADDLTGRAMPTSHFVVEDEPGPTAEALSAFLHRRPSAFPIPEPGRVSP